MINIIISALAFILYVGWIWIRFGEQKSISDSVYRLTKKQRWLFAGMLYFVTIPMAMLVSGYTEYLPYGILTLSIVGSTYNIKSSIRIRILHYIGAIGGISMTIICLWAELGYWIPTAVMVIGSAILAFFEHKLWRIEILAFLTILTTLIIHTLCL